MYTNSYLFKYHGTSLCSYSRCEVLIIFILNNTYDVVLISTFRSSSCVHTNHKLSMNSWRTLKYALEGCVFALVAVLYFLLMCLFPFVVNATKTKDCKFWWMIRVTRRFITKMETVYHRLTLNKSYINNHNRQMRWACYK